MARFKPENNTFRTQEAMRLLINLLGNFRGRVADSDLFAAPAKLLDRAMLKSWFETAFSEKTRKAIFHQGLSGDRVDFDDSMRELLRCLWCAKPVRPALLERFRALQVPKGKGADPRKTRFDEFCELMRYNAVEREILLVCHLVWADLLAWPTNEMSRPGSPERLEAIAMFADRSIPEVRAALMPEAPLRRFECIDEDFDFNSHLGDFLSGVTDAPLESRFYHEDKEKPLPWTWFGKLADEHGTMLRGLLATGTRSVNVLLYGAPGTGKTSFARALAAQTGRDCFFVAQDPDWDRSTRRSGIAARLCALHACDGQVDPERSLVVVDEADDLLSNGDKGALNEMLDSLQVPVVWVCNASPRNMDGSNCRRFDYSVRFDALTDAQRSAIWRNRIAEEGLEGTFPPGTVDDWGARWPVSAGGISTILRNVARLHPTGKDATALVEKLMRPHCELLGIREADDRLRPARDYSLEGLSLVSSVPLARILDAARSFRAERSGPESARGVDRPRFNLLLSGPPGTGKTEFVKHLGAELGAKILVRMGSDLLSCWVGRTEQNIAMSFREAENEDAILFLDEVDGLLRSRGMAQQSWEVTQVNELLYQMENFRGILVCATNFSDNLDPATARRFTFKVAFDYLTAEGKAIFFERLFGVRLSRRDRAELDAIPNLAPGDFRTVRQSLHYLGGAPDAPTLLRALREESDAKRDRGVPTRCPVGFRLPA